MSYLSSIYICGCFSHLQGAFFTMVVHMCQLSLCNDRKLVTQITYLVCLFTVMSKKRPSWRHNWRNTKLIVFDSKWQMLAFGFLWLCSLTNATESPKMIDQYSRTRTLPKKYPIPTPYVEVSPKFSFTFAVEELSDEKCPQCYKCLECPACPKCRKCPKCPDPPKCEVCRACPTPCPPCKPCPACEDDKVPTTDDENGLSNRIFFFEML